MFMQNYLDIAHMAELPPMDPSLSYYIPYHVINTAKFRIVFDSSCPTSSGISYNDQQLPGPRLQPDLADLFLSFRMHKNGLTADIVQMFRQVRVAEY